jgi:hypothetical protein
MGTTTSLGAAPRRASALHTVQLRGVHNNVVAYTLRVHRAAGAATPCAVPGLVVRAHAPALGEDKYHAHACLTAATPTWTLPLTFHGFNTPRGAIKNTLLRPTPASDDLVLQLFLDPHTAYEVWRFTVAPRARLCNRLETGAWVWGNGAVGGAGRRGGYAGPSAAPLWRGRHRVPLWPLAAGAGAAAGGVGSYTYVAPVVCVQGASLG